jgi:type IV pilus assembly protein PilE
VLDHFIHDSTNTRTMHSTLGQRMHVPAAPRPYPARLAGFTLIELLIAIAIVAILAAIALPSYQAQIRKGHRAAAQSYMMDLAQREGQYLLDARAYASTEAALGAATPATVASYYTIGIAAPAVSPPAFAITATAIGAQVVDGDLSIDNKGTKTPPDKW